MKLTIPVTLSISPAEVSALEKMGIVLEWETAKGDKSPKAPKPYYLRNKTYCRLCGSVHEEIWEMRGSGDSLRGYRRKELPEDIEEVREAQYKINRCLLCRETLERKYRGDMEGLIDHFLVHLKNLTCPYRK